MVIHEIFIQGLSGQSGQLGARPRKVGEDRDLFEEAIHLQGEIEARTVYTCIRSLIYPTHESKKLESLFAEGESPRAGVVFSERGKVVRCIRGAERDSVTLQVERIQNNQRQWDTVGRGIRQVEEIFATQISRPAFEAFETIVSWCDPHLFHQENDAEAAIEQAIDNDLSINSLMIMYENAYMYEQAKADVGRISQQLYKRTTSQNGISPNERINPVQEVNARQKASLEKGIEDLMIEIGRLGLGDLKQQDFNEVKAIESEIPGTLRELRRMDDLKHNLEKALQHNTVKPWLSDPRYWALLVCGLLCVVVPFFLPEKFAFIMFFSFIFITASTWILFQSARKYSQQARTFSQLKRLEERYAKEKEQHAMASQKLKYFMLATGSINLSETEQRFERRQLLVHKLAQQELELKNFLSKMGPGDLPDGDLKYQPRNPNATLLHELEVARNTLADAEMPRVPSQVLAKKIAKQGYDTSRFDAVDDIDSLKEHENLLIIQATQAGFLLDGVLLPEVEALWNQLLHRFMHNSLYFCVLNGKIDISSEKSKKPSSPNWKEERPNVLRWVLFTFCCAIIEFMPKQEPQTPLPNLIFCLHPNALAREDDQRRLRRIITGTEEISWVLIQP